MVTEDEQHDAEYLDDKEFQAKFLLDPDIPEEVKGQYGHLDKNLAITNLRASRKDGVDEPEEFRSLSRGMHVLNNAKYYEDVSVDEFTGEYKDVVASDGKSVIQLPVIKRKVKSVSKFPKTFHSIRSDLFAFSNTSASRGGHRIRAATTTRRVKEESFEQRSNVNSRWAGSRNK